LQHRIGFAAARTSIQMIAGRTGRVAASSATHAATGGVERHRLDFACRHAASATAWRTERAIARHQSSGSCSAWDKARTGSGTRSPRWRDTSVEIEQAGPDAARAAVHAEIEAHGRSSGRDRRAASIAVPHIAALHKYYVY